MGGGIFDTEQLAAYQRDGYVVVRNLFDAEEVDLLRQAAKEDRALDEHAFGREDGEGGSVRLSLWNHPGEDLYGMFARGRRIVDTVEQVLEDEAYHYHSKMVMKQAVTGGAWEWHQDYGYWYENGVLEPNLCSVYTAVDKANKENGCLQVLKGSHRMGRVTHVKMGDQTCADLDRVAAAAERLELVYCEMEPGDSVFFHSNLLHRSDQNHSPNDRWALICCYNARQNSPYKEGPHPCYTPLEKVDDAAIKLAGVKRFSDSGGNDSFMAVEHAATSDGIADHNPTNDK
ncbi:MAG: phytanoyl-CoA dioxygenase family protein [Planctomycetes bacterium]|nr:phytanoyl-CoA dioxygenase family protein [Planctomycetota bacterium]